jgi:hypothetical protein
MKRVITFFLLLLSYYINSSYSQDYYFSVPKADLNVNVLSSAGATLHYNIEFVNTANGHVIDVVDVGLPKEEYDQSNARAWIDGKEVAGPIRPSQYVKPGLEVHLGSLSIAPGGSGLFEFEIRISDLVFQDTTRKDYASFQIGPTWFGEQYVQGSTDLTIRVTLPPGLKPEEVLYQDVPFDTKTVLPDGKILVTWGVNRRFTGPYRVGLSFPKRVVTHVIKMSIGELLAKWWRGAVPDNVRLWLALGSVVALSIVYLRFTANTGCLFLVPLLIAYAFFFFKFELTQVLIWPLVVVGFIMVERSRRRRGKRYLPAIASVEGGGIKRGLTAPEAAVLLELPINKVITLILFGMMKKGMIRQVSKDPITFEVEKNLSPDAVLHNYEKTFLDAIRKQSHSTSTFKVSEIDFSKPVKSLVTSVADRMVGYELRETRGYYEFIISRAWKEAKEIGDIESWQKKVDEKVDWMMLDPGFTDKFQPYQDMYVPRSYRPTTVSAGSPSQATGGSKTSPASAPRFSDVAASVSGWFQNTAAGVVGTIEGKEGIVNFGSMDKAISKAMESSSRSGSGGGGGCACACAGCACACACAGGGR